MSNSEILDKVARGLAYREYSLLLGAGASVDAIGGNGRPLPTGAGLKDALMEDFGIDSEGEELLLAEIYDDLQRERRGDVDRYLHSWFSNCQPSWQGLLAEFNWKRIWSLNIDDVIENAFAKVGRSWRSLSWYDRFADSGDLSVQQIIHLHGMSNRLSTADSDELVFSISDYAREVANVKTWHKVFSDEFAARPFVVIGAQLTEEFDLAGVLDGGSVAEKSTGYPSVLVVPRINQIRLRRLESAGLVVVQSTGEQFVAELLEHYRTIRDDIVSQHNPAPPSLMKFLQQFIDLRTYSPRDVSGDFYSGYQPTWKTIENNDDAILDKTNSASAEIAEIALSQEITQKVILLAGNPGSGKSTGLLRIASNLIGHGIRPFLFRGDEYIDIDATAEWLRTTRDSVLFFDDLADQSTTIQRLAEKCTKENVKMLLVGSDRPARHRIMNDRIDSRYLDLSEAHWYGRLTDTDVGRIIDKLHSRGRLGIVTRRSPENQRLHFVETANRSLFDGMSELEGGIGFREKVREVYHGLRSEDSRRLYAAACLCYDQSVPLPAGIAADFAKVKPADLLDLLDNELRGILILTRIGIRPPHRIMASLLVRTLQDSVRSDVSFALAVALAPHIDQTAMRLGTREHRIVRHLMDHRNVARYSGRESGSGWYNGLLQYYDWNGRYWDQRALFESRYGHHEMARSYAERSIQVHRHSFGYNTLGTVLLRMALDQRLVDELYEGIENLDTSRRFREWEAREHPYTAFFTYLIQYAERWGLYEIPQQTRNQWEIWFREALSSQVFSSAQGQRQLAEWNKRWLQCTVVK